MTNLEKAITAEHADDVALIKQFVPLLRSFSDVEVERMYEAFSREYSCGWSLTIPEWIEEFHSWLFREI